MVSDGSGAVSTRARRRLVAATMIGNTIEFYDFTVYGTLTALVFSKVFFPASAPSVGTLLALTTFAVGFVSRPLGGIAFGHLGDRIGRKPTMMISMLLMGGATTLMGVLPTYETAGIAAPVMLAVLRFLQGFGIGGEWGGAVTLMLESTPSRRRGFLGSAVQTGSGFGIILSAITVTTLSATLSTDQLLKWGWRIPLLFSVVLIVVGLVIRARIDESPEFAMVKARHEVAHVPVFETLRRHWRMVLLAIGMYIGVAAFGFTQGVFFVGYLVSDIGLERSSATEANLTAAVTSVVFTVVGGLLSDRIGRSRTYIIGGLLLIPSPFIMFGAGATGNVPLIFVAMGVIGMLTGVGYGAQAALFFDLFPAKLRYTGISLGFQTAAVIGGGLTPLMAAAIFSATGSTLLVSLYIVALSLLLIGCTLGASRLVKRELVRTADGIAVSSPAV